MLAEFSGVLLILVLAVVVAVAMLAMQRWLGPKRDFAAKREPFECGERQIAPPNQRFSVKFYLVAMLFVIFDLEAVFFYPFGALFRERFMDINVSMPLEEALDLCWKTLSECFDPQELLMKQSLIDRYFPKSRESQADVGGQADAVAPQGAANSGS